jgi:hypothetical protein
MHCHRLNKQISIQKQIPHLAACLGNESPCIGDRAGTGLLPPSPVPRLETPERYDPPLREPLAILRKIESNGARFPKRAVAP